MTEPRRRILLVRLDGLGDALACVPALEGLRRAMPDATFGAVCSDANAALFSPARVERVYRVAELRSASYNKAAGKMVFAGAYTDAIVATEEPIGYRIARESGAMRRAGFWHRFEKTFKSLWQYAQLTDAVYRPAAWVDRPEHEVSAIYRLAERLGARRPIPDDARSLRAWLDVARDGTRPIGADAFAFQVAPKSLANGWDAASIADMLDAALATGPYRRCVLLASHADQGLARSIMEHLPPQGPAREGAAHAPEADLPHWLAALATAGALVTPDTGAAHAAGILGVPVVDLFESARFDQLSRQWRPWAADSRCLAKPPMSAGAARAFGAQIGAALDELARAERALP